MPAATVSKEEDCKKYTVMSQEYTDCVNEIRGQSVITDLKNEFGFSFSKPEDFKISFFLKFDDPNTSSFGGKYFLMFVGKKDPKNWILIATNEKEPCSKLNKFCNLNQQSSFAEYMKENRCGTTELLEVNVNGIYVTKHQLKWPIMTDTLEGDAYLFSGKNVGVLIGGSDSKIVENFVKSVKFEDAIKIEDVP